MTLGHSAVESHLHERATDTASERLIAELVLDDIAAVRATRKGKARDDDDDALGTDQVFALDLLAAELSSLIDVFHDRHFALSIDRAIESDQLPLRRIALLDQAEHDDHRAAVALRDGHDLPWQTFPQRMMALGVTDDGGSFPPSPEHVADTTETDEDDEDVINVGVENVHITHPVASESVPTQSSKNIDKGLECVICGDDVVPSRSFNVSCGHHYCRDCVVGLVDTSLRDESLHPLRCCRRPLPLASGVFKFISVPLRLQFLAKSREYATPPRSRVYCSNPRCSAFLDTSGNARRDLVCARCATVSCSRCKNSAHPGEDCSEHQSALDLRETATANRWQTCPGCHAIVELSQGCYHITCRCSTQFCYLCAARWKTCSCRQWDEERLLDDAERRVRNEFGNRAAEAQPAVHAERVFRRMEALREDHECRAHFWRYRHGCGRCEECGDFLPIFLMRCTNCQTLACKRCSVNRL